MRICSLIGVVDLIYLGVHVDIEMMSSCVAAFVYLFGGHLLSVCSFCLLV